MTLAIPTKRRITDSGARARGIDNVMKILTEPITVSDLKTMAAEMFGDMVKVVVDVERELVALDAELHSDIEALFLDDGSKQNSLWGINLYPDLWGDDFIEFDSMINMRPSQKNMSRGVDNQETREKIIKIVNKWVKP